MIRFTIPGPPRTKKTSNRLVKFGNRHKILPSKAFEQWNLATQYILVNARARGLAPAGTFPISHVMNCCAVIYRDALRGDAVGYYQALADALQEAGIVENDRLIVSWDGSRMLKDAKNPRIEVTLTAADVVDPQKAQVKHP